MVSNSHGPYFLIFNFVFAFAVLSPRGLKRYLRLDDNVSPREVTSLRGERAVRDGKISAKQLAMLKRNEAAHANAVENFPLLVAGILSAQAAGVDGSFIDRAALAYTVARVVYAVNYCLTESRAWSVLRSLSWWAGNVTCFVLLWKAKVSASLNSSSS